MTIKRGSRVKYRAGVGHGVGKVTQVKDGKATIATGNGTTVVRKVENLKNPDEDEPGPLVDTVAADPGIYSPAYCPAHDADIDLDGDGDEEDTELEGDEDDE